MEGKPLLSVIKGYFSRKNLKTVLAKEFF